jgi:hypothetical protein
MMATNNGPVEQALPLESKKRLNVFKQQLASDVTDVQFDKPVLEVLQKYALDPILLERNRGYLNNLKDENGFLFSRSFKSSKMLYENTMAFTTPDYTSFRWNSHYQDAKAEMLDEVRHLQLAPLSYSCDDDVIEAIPKLDTHSGWTYILSGKRKKGENLEDIFSKWTAESNLARQVGSFNKPIMPGVRTQASGEFDEHGRKTDKCKHKTRLVSMIDLIQIIAELRFARPFQRYIGNRRYYAGGKSARDISSIIFNMRAKWTNYVSLDYSRFDQTISSWLIYDAFDVVKAAFRSFNQEEEQIWNIVVHDFIHKTFVTKDGFVQSHKGVPSGSMFTQIIDSIVNRLMITTFLKTKKIEGEMIIMGDDNLLYYRRPSSGADIRIEIASYLQKNFGITCNGEKSSYGTSGDNPEFLSRTWRLDGEWRHPNVLTSKLLFPERFRRYDAISTPALVVYSYILAYGAGMRELIDVAQFLLDFEFKPADLERMDSRNMPGYLKYTYHNTKELSALAA